MWARLRTVTVIDSGHFGGLCPRANVGFLSIGLLVFALLPTRTAYAATGHIAYADTNDFGAIAYSPSPEPPVPQPVGTPSGPDPPLTPQEQHVWACVTDLTLRVGAVYEIGGESVKIIDLVHTGSNAYIAGVDLGSGQWEELYWDTAALVPGGSCPRVVVDLVPRPSFDPVPVSELPALKNGTPVNITLPAGLPGPDGVSR